MRTEWLRASIVTAGVFAIAVMLAACGGAAAVDPQDVGDPERGSELFENGGANNTTACMSCHSLDGSEYRAGPSLQGISKRADERVPELSAADYIRQSILDPSAYVVEGFNVLMGTTESTQYAEQLTDQEVNDLIAFLLTQ